MPDEAAALREFAVRVAHVGPNRPPAQWARYVRDTPASELDSGILRALARRDKIGSHVALLVYCAERLEARSQADEARRMVRVVAEGIMSSSWVKRYGISGISPFIMFWLGTTLSLDQAAEVWQHIDEE
jgi:hypothetical protein